MVPDALLTVAMAGTGAGFVAGLALAAPAALRPPRSPWPSVVVAATAIVGAVVLVLYAASDDGYYGMDVTRWEHAGRNGSRPLVVAAIALAALAGGLLALRRRPRWSALTLALGGLACGAVAVAIVGIGVGH